MKKQMGTVKWYSLVMAAVCMFTTVTYGQNADIPEVEPSPDPAVENVEVAAESQQVNLSVSEARVQDVLRSLASLRKDVNIVIDPGVTGTVSLQLDGVPWKTALDLITDSQGLVYTKEGPNIYRVSVSAEKIKQGVIVELFTAEEAEALSDVEVRQLVGEEGVPVEEARARVENSPHLYIKQLSVDESSALGVVKDLAAKAGLNYTFSPLSDQSSAPKKEAAAAKPAPEIPPISLNLRNLSVERAMILVADQGGLSVIEEEGVWVISQLTPKQLQVEPLKLETFNINFIPLDNDLVGILQSLVSGRGKVVRGKNKIIIVKDTKKGIDVVRQILDVIDIPTPQVLIEARFFQVNNSEDVRLGVDWQDLGDPEGATFGASTDNLAFDYWDTKKAVDLPDGGVDPSAIDAFDTSDARTAILSLPDFSVVLHALKGNNQAEELANPKIVVSSDEQATIHIGKQRPIIKTEIDSTEAGGSLLSYELDDAYGGETVEELTLGPEADTSGRTFQTNKGYLDLGTKLTVLPSVKTEEEVYIKVVPELMSVVGERSFPLQGEAAGETAGTIDFPELFRTYVRTQFTVKSGQTIAIGGLVSKRMNTDETKVPLLGSIPYLGRAFRYNQDSVEQSETIIFLTVKIIAGKELNASSAIPVRSRGVQEELDRIKEEDARGAVYDSEYVKELIDELEEADKDTAAERLKRKLLNPRKKKDVDEAEEKEAVEEEMPPPVEEEAAEEAAETGAEEEAEKMSTEEPSEVDLTEAETEGEVEETTVEEETAGE